MEDVHSHSPSFSSSMTTTNPSSSYHLDPLDSEIAIALEFFAKKVLSLLLNFDSSNSNSSTKHPSLNKRRFDTALKPFLVFDCIKSTYLSLEPCLFLTSDIAQTLPYTLSQLIQVTLFAGAIFLSPKEVRPVNYQLCANALICKDFIVETWVSRAQLNQVILELKTQAYLAGGDLQEIFNDDRNEVGELLWRLLETRKKELIKTPLSRLGLKYKRSSFVNLIDSFLRTLVLGEFHAPSILETWLHLNLNPSSSSNSSNSSPLPLHPSSSSDPSSSPTSMASPSPIHSLSYPDPPSTSTPAISSSSSSSSNSSSNNAITSTLPAHLFNASNLTWMPPPPLPLYQPSSSSSSSTSSSSSHAPPPPAPQYTPPPSSIPPPSSFLLPMSTSSSTSLPSNTPLSNTTAHTTLSSSTHSTTETAPTVITTPVQSSFPPLRDDPNDVWQDPSFLLSDLFSDEELIQEASSYFKGPGPSSHSSSSSSNSSLNSFASSFSGFVHDEDGYEEDQTSARIWRSPHPSSPSIPPNLPLAPLSSYPSSLPSYSHPPSPPPPALTYPYDPSSTSFSSTSNPSFTTSDPLFHPSVPPQPSLPIPSFSSSSTSMSFPPSISETETTISPTALSSSSSSSSTSSSKNNNDNTSSDMTHTTSSSSSSSDTPSTATLLTTTSMSTTMTTHLHTTTITSSSSSSASSLPPFSPLAPSSSSSSSSSVVSKHRRWTKEEEQALELGMHEFGSSYSKILYYYGKDGVRSQVLQYRDQVQLKDKARNIRANREKRNQVLGPFVHAIMPLESRVSKKKKKG